MPDAADASEPDALGAAAAALADAAQPEPARAKGLADLVAPHVASGARWLVARGYGGRARLAGRSPHRYRGRGPRRGPLRLGARPRARRCLLLHHDRRAPLHERDLAALGGEDIDQRAAIDVEPGIVPLGLEHEERGVGAEDAVRDGERHDLLLDLRVAPRLRLEGDE